MEKKILIFKKHLFKFRFNLKAINKVNFNNKGTCVFINLKNTKCLKTI